MKSVRQRPRLAKGFSLVEIMLALVIGMLATVIVLQLFSDSEARNRTATGSADSQSNGVITFNQMQGHIQRAGYGLNAVALFNCQLTWTVATGDALTKNVVIAPVSINPKTASNTLLLPAGDANTDTLLILYGNGNSQPEGSAISQDATAPAAPVYTINAAAYAVGDRVIPAPSVNPDSCPTVLAMDRVASVFVVPASLGSTRVTATLANAGVSLFNLGPGPNGLASASSAGNGPTIVAYAIRSGNLTACDFSVNDCTIDASASKTSVWVPVASGIVGLHAVYKSDTAWTNVYTTVYPAAGRSTISPQPNTACEWAKIKAIQLVMVARSDERDKSVVTTAANQPAWTQEAVAPLVANAGALTSDGSGAEEWRHYRYKTFQSVIPMRNMAWMGKPTPCP